MNVQKHSKESGAVSGGLIAIILLIIGMLILTGLAVWLFLQYNEQKSNVDAKIDTAVAKAERDQSETETLKFAEREKEPNRDFVGPEDYGRLSFKYPKTWSVYIAKDASKGGTYEAYLNPVSVPQVSSTERYALRVVIEEKDYSTVISSYDTKVKKGDLKSRVVTANGQSGTRFDGTFSKNVRGSVVIFKVRDKTLSVFTDAETFTPDFNKLIKTIEFNS